MSASPQNSSAEALTPDRIILKGGPRGGHQARRGSPGMGLVPLEEVFTPHLPRVRTKCEDSLLKAGKRVLTKHQICRHPGLHNCEQ